MTSGPQSRPRQHLASDAAEGGRGTRIWSQHGVSKTGGSTVGAEACATDIKGGDSAAKKSGTVERVKGTVMMVVYVRLNGITPPASQRP